jgi:hemerythrin-like domain-containing protein
MIIVREHHAIRREVVHPIQSQHATLRACAQDLESKLGRLAGGTPEAVEATEVLGLIVQFRRRLVEHLASEERNGILELAAAAEPRFAHQIGRLREEHGELRTCMDSLVADTAEVSWLFMHARFVAFRRFLFAHEQAEDDVLQCAYLEDLGGGD